MREREEVFDHFITAVINTLNADEIYDAAIEALQDILQPDGLLLMMNQTHATFFPSSVNVAVLPAQNHTVFPLIPCFRS